MLHTLLVSSTSTCQHARQEAAAVAIRAYSMTGSNTQQHALHPADVLNVNLGGVSEAARGSSSSGDQNIP
jgi:hypothetical protein